MDCTGRQRHHHSSHHRYLRSRNLQQSQESPFLIVRFRSATTPSTAGVPLGAGVADHRMRCLGPLCSKRWRFCHPGSSHKTDMGVDNVHTHFGKTNRAHTAPAGGEPTSQDPEPAIPSDEGICCSNGTRTAFQPSQTQGTPENIDDPRASPADVRPSSRRKSGLCPHLLFVTSKPLRPAGKRTAT
jgi:hypothetical protein